MEYLYTARFLCSLKKCEPAVQDDVCVAIYQFESGKNRGLLKLHKLHGKFKGLQAFSANFSYRIIVKIERQITYYMDVGTHEVYR